jgi:hypothetical protein
MALGAVKPDECMSMQSNLMNACLNTPHVTPPPPRALSFPCRIAARKCRAKKNALMTDLQSTLAGLMRKNEEYKLQVGA